MEATLLAELDGERRRLVGSVSLPLYKKTDE
jgi:hypothetical protein